MEILKNFSLKKHNTFALECTAAYFIEIKHNSQLVSLLQSEVAHYFNQKNFVVLGMGSNVVFRTNKYNGLVIYLNTKGKQIIKESNTHVWIKAQAGEVWDDFVAYTLQQNAYGLENLSLIPGKIGASAVQNIGAYGVEAKDFIDAVDIFDLENLRSISLTNQQCHFAYRNSIFKKQLKNKAVVTAVTFKLLKTPQLNLSYSALGQALKSEKNLTPHQLRQTVIQIRQSKLPDYTKNPNCGSFFQNPIVSKTLAEQLKQKYPQIPLYPYSDEQIKISAGWLIDQAGWKGKSVGGAAVFEKQALVLYNQNNATANDVLALAEAIKNDIQAKYEIFLIEEAIYI